MDKKDRVKRIFDSISHKYDFLNHFLSAGIDLYWRRKALKLTKIDPSKRLLDIACGTGDFAIAAKKIGVKKIFGADLSLNMLKLFSKKASWIRGNTIQTTAENVAFKSRSFDNITVAFGVRNFYNIEKSLNAFNNVLTKDGKVTILEFRLPSSKIIKSIYLFYFNKLLPFIGKVVSKDKEAYRYLPDSVNEFNAKIDLPELLKNAGFAEVQKYNLTLGIVQVIIGQK